MDEGSVEDYALLHSLETDYVKGLPDRIINALLRLDDTLGGYQVTRLQHSLQSATRAEADGADIELIVAALIHDIGDELAPEITHKWQLVLSVPMCVLKSPGF